MNKITLTLEKEQFELLDGIITNELNKCKELLQSSSIPGDSLIESTRLKVVKEESDKYLKLFRLKSEILALIELYTITHPNTPLFPNVTTEQKLEPTPISVNPVNVVAPSINLSQALATFTEGKSNSSKNQSDEDKDVKINPTNFKERTFKK